MGQGVGGVRLLPPLSHSLLSPAPKSSETRPSFFWIFMEASYRGD